MESELSNSGDFSGGVAHKKQERQPLTASNTNDLLHHQERIRTQSGATKGNRAQEKLLEPILQAGILYSIGRKDRSGSVITDMLYAHAFAFAHNVTYAGACYTKQGFPRNDVRQLLQGLGWSRFLSFNCPNGVGIQYDILKPKAEDLSPLVIDEHLYRSKLHLYFNNAWRDRIRSLVKPPPETTNLFEIAVHVRRGDVTPCRYKRRYLPNHHYLQLIDQFTPTGKATHVTIYSETESYESLDVFRQRGYDVKLDTEDLARVWSSLATADVVILSRSFFSFVPALLNSNTVVYTKFFDFEPLEGWTVADENLTKETDKEIRRMFNENCDHEEVEQARQLEVERHRGALHTVPSTTSQQ